MIKLMKDARILMFYSEKKLPLSYYSLGPWLYSPTLLLKRLQKHRTVSNRLQRDLNWCIKEPALIDGETQPGPIIWPTDEWFRRQSVPELSDLQPPPARFRLGIHFEKLYQRWIRSSPDYDLLESNLQIHGDGRTLGEFDLLVSADRGHEHWELAIKFYINQGNAGDPGHWFGPDPADTLASKLDRFISYQFPLANRSEAIAKLATLDIQIEQARCIMKGRLYHPWSAYQQGQLLTPTNVNPNHKRGWWLPVEQLDLLSGQSVVYLDKSLWLSELLADDVEATISVAEVKSQVARSEQIALQYALLDESSNEISRGFILKPRWFELANQPVKASNYSSSD